MVNLRSLRTPIINTVIRAKSEPAALVLIRHRVFYPEKGCSVSLLKPTIAPRPPAEREPRQSGFRTRCINSSSADVILRRDVS